MSIEKGPQDPPREEGFQVTVTYQGDDGTTQTETLSPNETEGLLATIDDQLNEED